MKIIAFLLLTCVASFAPTSRLNHGSRHGVESRLFSSVEGLLPEAYRPSESEVRALEAPLPPQKRVGRNSDLAPFHLWKKRLNTKEDKMKAHKISSAAMVLSSTVIMLTGALNGFHEVPQWLGPFDGTYLLSQLFMSMSSIEMANSHRRSEPAVRDFFNFMSWAVIDCAFVVEAYSPFQHGAMLLPNKMMLDILLAGPIFIMSGALLNCFLFSTKDIIQTRRDSKKDDSQIRPEEILNYLLAPILFLCLGGLFAAMVLDPSHDKTWLLESTHGRVSEVYYTQAFTSLGISYIALAVTLRDKKLISKQTETIINGILGSALVGTNFISFLDTL